MAGGEERDEGWDEVEERVGKEHWWPELEGRCSEREELPPLGLPKLSCSWFDGKKGRIKDINRELGEVWVPLVNEPGPDHHPHHLPLLGLDQPLPSTE